MTASLSAPRCYLVKYVVDGRLTISASTQTSVLGQSCFNLQPSIWGSFPARSLQLCIGSNGSTRRLPLDTCVKCEKKEKPAELEEITVEFPPYHVYMDSTSGQLEPASGARASIPDPDYWPEGTADRVRAARAPEPKGESKGSSSFGKSPGSRRKNYKNAAVAHGSSEVTDSSSKTLSIEASDDQSEDADDVASDFVVYDTEPEEEVTGYDLDKKLGLPHPFIDPKLRRKIDQRLPDDDIWWNWRKKDHPKTSRWQRRKPDVETVFLKAMAETGQVKLFGKEPTITETALYRARRHLFKQERLQAEQERHEMVGSVEYYSEWVKAWKRDTSREAIKKHFEETGEDETTQLIEMFCHQTDREYRIMRGTDVRIPRDPLAMRMREDQIKQIWGGDPVYPTINYIQDPNETIDFRGPDFEEPFNLLNHLMEEGKVISREEIQKILAKEKKKEQVPQIKDIDDAMAKAVDIGENDEEVEDSDVEDEEQGEEKLPRNWSVLKSTPELQTSEPKIKKDDSMSLEEAIDDSENLTDFLMDFDEEDEE